MCCAIGPISDYPCLAKMDSSDLSPYERARLKNMYEIQAFMYANGLRKVPPKPLELPKSSEVVESASTSNNMSGSKRKAADDESEVKFGVTPCDAREEKRVLRPRKMMTYAEEIVPNADDYIFCDICQEDYFEGCSFHPALRNDDKNLIAVKPSTIKNAGRGVFNNSGKPIAVGTLFGPYTGEMIKPAEYKKRQEAGNESGYAWELMDSEKKRVIGYVDPGSDPDPAVDWLAMVNSANFVAFQNIIAVQLKGAIYYRVCKTIPNGAELLTYYGDEYARTIKIDPEKFKRGMQLGGFGSASSKGKKPGVKKHFCQICGNGFTEKSKLERHVKSIHEGQRFDCRICAKSFNRNNNLNRHIETVHELQRAHACRFCNAKFGHKQNARRHERTMHPAQVQMEHAFFNAKEE